MISKELYIYIYIQTQANKQIHKHIYIYISIYKYTHVGEYKKETYLEDKISLQPSSTTCIRVSFECET